MRYESPAQDVIQMCILINERDEILKKTYNGSIVNNLIEITPVENMILFIAHNQNVDIKSCSLFVKYMISLKDAFLISGVGLRKIIYDYLTPDVILYFNTHHIQIIHT